MKHKDQVCSFEQAVELKKMGVEYKHPLFAYVERLNEFKLQCVPEFDRWAAQYNELFAKDRNHYPAFTVAELGCMLGNDLLTKYPNYIFQQDWTEAKCRAATLLHCIKIKLVKVKDINERLCPECFIVESPKPTE